jgi:site-specific recombinase XerD
MFYVNEFLDHLKTCRYSPKTIREYGYVLKHLKSHFERNGIDDVKQISEGRMHEYLENLEHRQQSGKSAYIRAKRLGKYFQFLEEAGYLFLSPLQDWSIRSYPKSSFPAIDETQIERMLSGIKTDSPLCLKGKAMMELAYSSALRPRELYNLKITDIDFKKELLFIEQSKGNKDRVVPVGKQALRWTEKYITEARPKYIKGKKHEFVFISHKTGEKLTVWGVRWAIRQTLEHSGFTPIKPYSLRHTAATALLNNGMPVGYISNLLGHAEIRTTQIYLNVKALELKREIQAKHPRVAFEKRLCQATQEERRDEV